MQLVESILRVALLVPDTRRRAALNVLLGLTALPSVAPSIEKPELYVTLKECGKQLGFAACTLWMWKVPSHSLGGRPRFRVSEVAAYLKSDAFKRRVAELKEKRRGKYRKQSKKPQTRQGG